MPSVLPHPNRLTVCALVFAAVMCWASATALCAQPAPKPPQAPNLMGGRFGGFTKKAATGPHMTVVAATFFGGPGAEEFVDVGCLADESLVAFGNAWGPQFPGAPAPTILGRGQHSGQPATTKDSKGRETLNLQSPDVGGMLVFYTPDLQRILKVVKLDWGVGRITAGKVTADGKGLILAGRCGPAFKTFAALFGSSQVLPAQAPAAVPAPKGKAAPAAAAGDVYIARLSADGKPEWVWALEKAGHAPEKLFLDNAGAVYFDAAGLRRISPDARELTQFSTKAGSGQTGWLGVDPKDGCAYFGGDRNSHTNREPYRQPYFYKFNAKGEKVWTLYEPAPKEVGSDAAGLEADSSIRNLAFAKNGDMLLSGWSDGGNSVLSKQAKNWHEGIKSRGYGMDCSGMKSANSLMHLIRIKPDTLETLGYSFWGGYIPMTFSDPKFRGAPNGCHIDRLAVLDNGSVSFAGGAGTGLIQTPNAFYKYTDDGRKVGGEFVAVFNEEFTNLMFSSYLPGCQGAALAPTRKGVVVVSGTTGSDHSEVPPVTDTPAVKALQPQFGGSYDGHILLLALPSSSKGAEAAK